MAGRATKKGGGTKRTRSNSASKRKSSAAGGDDGDIKVEDTTKPSKINDIATHQSLPLLRSISTTNGRMKSTVGYVRATPPGHLLQPNTSSITSSSTSTLTSTSTTTDKEEETSKWNEIRNQPTKNGIPFPQDGFNHILGTKDIKLVDGIPIGGRIVELDGPYPANDKNTREKGGDDGCKEKKEDDDGIEPEEEYALQAELAQRRSSLLQMDTDTTNNNNNNSTSSTSQSNNNTNTTTTTTDRHEYGASRTPLDAPIGSLRDKWRVLPYFLKLRGLMKQHIDSFDHFVKVEMKQIVQVMCLFYVCVVLYVCYVGIDGLQFVVRKEIESCIYFYVL